MLLIKLFTVYKGIDFTQKIKVAPKIQYLLFYIFLYYLSKIILKHMESIYIFKKKRHDTFNIPPMNRIS